MQHLPQHKKIILFDGLCNLCDATVQFIIKRDTKDVFRFVSLQSDLGCELLQKLPIEFQLIDSVILYESEKVFFYKSQAVFEIVKSIGGIYYCLLIFKLLPNAITNSVYDFIAKNRFRWWGKKESCLVPSKDLQSKFLG
ncbi:thiol-disulfide oxidoreductase DCC family protein [Flavobacterium ammonificans]|jgi:predicted DCC family thiol-disulfide oxidoreductase YuxK|uniref:thiol-disulfide oxidoreductase DCC family protein n=1 Tax=Flavobacterium ammonificans TaxID=1751056 RepID=UPI001E3F9CE6|nr:DCC1-like thiol-disulfide oxidoreductase family protein [Flavobacterium ammonificans]BDB57358.1 thiol-disulfide oxidoreductase [Flavobacterium ammonificans]